MKIVGYTNIDTWFIRFQCQEKRGRRILKGKNLSRLEFLNDNSLYLLIVAVDTFYHGIENGLNAIVDVTSHLGARPLISAPGKI
jgi:hypothetical protein